MPPQKPSRNHKKKRKKAETKIGNHLKTLTAHLKLPAFVITLTMNVGGGGGVDSGSGSG